MLVHLVHKGGDLCHAVFAFDNRQGFGRDHDSEADDRVGILSVCDGLGEGETVSELMRAAADSDIFSIWVVRCVSFRAERNP